MSTSRVQCIFTIAGLLLAMSVGTCQAWQDWNTGEAPTHVGWYCGAMEISAANGQASNCPDLGACGSVDFKIGRSYGSEYFQWDLDEYSDPFLTPDKEQYTTWDVYKLIDGQWENVYSPPIHVYKYDDSTDELIQTGSREFAFEPLDPARAGDYQDANGSPVGQYKIVWTAWDCGYQDDDGDYRYIPATIDWPASDPGTGTFYITVVDGVETITADADETVCSGRPGENYARVRPSGKLYDYRGGLFVGRLDSDGAASEAVWGPEGIGRSYIHFTLPESMVGKTVCSAKLRVYCSGILCGPDQTTGSLDVGVYKTSSSLTEDTLTWSNASTLTETYLCRQTFSSDKSSVCAEDRRINPWREWDVTEAFPTTPLTINDKPIGLSLRMIAGGDSSPVEDLDAYGAPNASNDLGDGWVYFAERHLTDNLSNSYAAQLIVTYH